MVKAAREKQQEAYKRTSKGYPWIVLQRKFCRSEESGTIYLRLWDARVHNEIYSTKQVSPSDLMER